MRYLLPKELGGGEYEALTDIWSKVGGETRVRFLIPGVGPVDIPSDALSPVPPPTPEEPTEPGLYAINGERGVQLLPTASTASWLVTGHVQFFTFAEVCEMFGPDVTIQRLVVSPAEGDGAG